MFGGPERDRSESMKELKNNLKLIGFSFLITQIIFHTLKLFIDQDQIVEIEEPEQSEQPEKLIE